MPTILPQCIGFVGDQDNASVEGGGRCRGRPGSRIAVAR